MLGCVAKGGPSSEVQEKGSTRLLPPVVHRHSTQHAAPDFSHRGRRPKIQHCAHLPVDLEDGSSSGDWGTLLLFVLHLVPVVLHTHA